MNSTSPHLAPDRTLEDRFAGLLDMGFERIDPGPATTESVRLDADTHKLTQIRPAMGSFTSITAVHRSHGLAEHAIGTAFDEMDRLTRLLSRFDPASALSYLNDTGRVISGPPELSEVVESSLAFSRLTGGAFDITVKPIIDLFRDPISYAPRSKPPDRAELREALELVDTMQVKVSGSDVHLARAGTGLTLDGIAKGYIVDAIAASLRRQGVSRFLINAGGDIRVSSTRGDARPWTIAVRDPEAKASSWNADAWGPGSHVDAIPLIDGAVATSGSYEVYFDRDRLAHHIVQARTGESPRGTVSVTVTAPTTVEADALATAVFVLGPGDGMRLIERTKGCECLVIDRNGNQTRSHGWTSAYSRRGAGKREQPVRSSRGETRTGINRRRDGTGGE